MEEFQMLIDKYMKNELNSEEDAAHLYVHLDRIQQEIEARFSV